MICGVNFYLPWAPGETRVVDSRDVGNIAKCTVRSHQDIKNCHKVVALESGTDDEWMREHHTAVHWEQMHRWGNT